MKAVFWASGFSIIEISLTASVRRYANLAFIFAAKQTALYGKYALTKWRLWSVQNQTLFQFETPVVSKTPPSKSNVQVIL